MMRSNADSRSVVTNSRVARRRQRVRHAHLAVASIGQRQVDRRVKRLATVTVRHHSSLAWRDAAARTAAGPRPAAVAAARVAAGAGGRRRGSRGAASGRARRRSASQTPAMSATEPLGLRPRVAQRDLPGRRERGRGRGARSGPRRGRSGSRSGRRCRAVQTHTLPARASSATHRSRSGRSALWPSAPGSRPVRVSTWNPLQMPITGGRRRRTRASASPRPMREVERQHAPGAERVGVAEAAGDAPAAVRRRSSVRVGEQFGERARSRGSAPASSRANATSWSRLVPGAGEHDGCGRGSSSTAPGERVRRARRRRAVDTPADRQRRRRR